MITILYTQLYSISRSLKSSLTFLYTFPLFKASATSLSHFARSAAGFLVGVKGRPFSVTTWCRKSFTPVERSRPIPASALLAAFFVFSSILTLIVDMMCSIYSVYTLSIHQNAIEFAFSASDKRPANSYQHLTSRFDLDGF